MRFSPKYFHIQPLAHPFVAPKHIFEPMAAKGSSDSIRLNESGRRFFGETFEKVALQADQLSSVDIENEQELVEFADANFESDPKRSLQLNLAKEILPEVQLHHENLSLDRTHLQARKAKYVKRKPIYRFKKEIAFSPVVVPLVSALVLLVAVLSLGINSEIETAVASIREGTLFETASFDPRLPAQEPSFVIALGYAFVPIFGLLISLEFICFKSRQAKSRFFLRTLGVIGVPLSLAVTWVFAYVIGGAMEPTSSIGAFQTTSPPWYSFGLNMTALAIVNAMVLHLLIQVVKQFFERAPSKERCCDELEVELNHLNECIVATAQTMGTLRSCISRIESERKEFGHAVFAAAAYRRAQVQRQKLQMQLNGFPE